MDPSGDDISIPLVWESTRTPPTAPSKPADVNPAKYLPLLEEVVYDQNGNEVQAYRGKRETTSAAPFVDVVEDMHTVWRNFSVRNFILEKTSISEKKLFPLFYEVVSLKLTYFLSFL
jgi:hypothetical protein